MNNVIRGGNDETFAEMTVYSALTAWSYLCGIKIFLFHFYVLCSPILKYIDNSNPVYL